MKINVIIEQDEAGFYVAEVPALPGCLSHRKTYEEAMSNIKEVIQGWPEAMESREEVDASRFIEIAV